MLKIDKLVNIHVGVDFQILVRFFLFYFLILKKK